MKYNNLKVFRLFISSTFSDFINERNWLQQDVFPKIDAYCQELGFSFHPIDLRWGITKEAQLDQKTLPLCIEEVQKCKQYPYPNFLVLIGDRYGWQPLPYMIDSFEFEQIIKHTPHRVSKKLLKQWYILDDNQIPSSYILKHRENPYDSEAIWIKIEQKLREILIDAKKSIGEDFLKYSFFSATEHELIEGICSYLEKTKYQQRLSLNEEEDKQNIFAFIRDIELKEGSGVFQHFIDSDKEYISQVKERLKKAIEVKNTLTVKTSLYADKLDLSYKSIFVQKIIEYLQDIIDKHIHSYKKEDEFERDKRVQEMFLQEKAHLFYGHKESLAYLQNYLHSEIQKPLVIYGKSGSGKSAFMAKAISQYSDKRTFFIFVSATASSASLRGLLEYICRVLNIYDAITEQKDLTKFSLQVKEKLNTITEPTTLFIDALDQLSNKDRLLWLPDILPKNLKIIITVLKDPNYEEDSQYFELLDKKYKNSYLLPKLQNVEFLLDSLLQESNRRLQKEQKDYVLHSYKKNYSPLYLKIISAEVSNWRSYDSVPSQYRKSIKHTKVGRLRTLASTSQEAIAQYLQNLSTLFHINRETVAKVASYLFIVRDGLTEVELIELLSSDEKYLSIVAPEIFHKNLTKRLPISIWSKLLQHLEIGLTYKEIESYLLMQFFHREIYSAVKDLFDIHAYHFELLGLLEKIIKRKQLFAFQNNRWGVLYSYVSISYIEHYKEPTIYKRVASFIQSLDEKVWIKSYISHLLKIATVYDYAFDKKAYIVLLQLQHLLEKDIVIEDEQRLQIALFYHKLGGYEYLHVNWKKGLKSLLIAAKLLESYIMKDKSSIKAKETLSQTYGRIGEMMTRYATRCSSISDAKKLQKVAKSIFFHQKSELLNLELLENEKSNIELNRKLGVVYERFATAYSVIDDEKNIRKYFTLAIKYKYRSYNRETDFNGFAMRKLFLVIAKRYEGKEKSSKVALYTRTLLKSIDDFYIDDAISKNNQYYLEQYLIIYELASKYIDERYMQMVEKIRLHVKARGIEE